MSGPPQSDFTLEEIIERAGKEGIAGTVRTSFNTALPTAHPIPAAIEYFSRRPRGDAASSAGATHVTQRGKGPKLLPTRRIYRTATACSSLGIVTGVLLPLSQPKVNDPLLSPVPGSSCGLTRTQMSTCRGSVKAGTKQGDRRKK